MKRGRQQRESAVPDEDRTLKNLLIAVLLLIIFVSLVGTVLVKNAIDDIRGQRAAPETSVRSDAVTGKVSVTILPSDSQKSSGGRGG